MTLHTTAMEAQQKRKLRAERRVAWVLLICLGIVIFWQVMGWASRRAWRAYELTPVFFAGYVPALEQWKFTARPVGGDPLEPNILAYEVRGRAPDAPLLTARLVHGYNTRDCMRIKGYHVEEVRDFRGAAESGLPPCQLWRMISPSGDVALWLTGMLRAGDFSETGADVRSMSFPRVGVPDDLHWVARGITRESLRHPVQSFRIYLRGRWNASRSDVWVFLGLKQPPWASHEDLTLVVASWGGTLRADQEPVIEKHLIEIYRQWLVELQAWRRKHGQSLPVESP